MWTFVKLILLSLLLSNMLPASLSPRCSKISVVGSLQEVFESTHIKPFYKRNDGGVEDWHFGKNKAHPKNSVEWKDLTL